MLPDEVRTFIRSSIRSIWGLELLFFLRAHKERAWAVKTLVRELRASEPAVRGSLGMFRAAGLVNDHPDNTVRYAPLTPDVDRLVGQVAEIYATHPSMIAEEIYAPDSKIQQFADAFRLKKE